MDRWVWKYPIPHAVALAVFEPPIRPILFEKGIKQMTNLTILNSSIRTYENLYSLTDLHRASGGESKHKPTFFLRNDQTKELIAEIEQESKLQNCNSVKILHGGSKSGTFACEELALAYATWISPKFHLVVLRAFIAMHKGEVQNTQPKLPLAPQEQEFTFTLKESELRNMAWLWFEAHKMREFIGNLLPSLETIGSRFAATAYSHNQEYGNHIKFMGPLIYRLTKDVDFSNRPTPIQALEEVVKQPNRLPHRY